MYFVYILSNNIGSVLYIGVTSNLIKRLFEHRNKLSEGFTKKYNVDNLVYYENFQQITDAIAAEKKLKGWTRKKKIALITNFNPTWKDLGNEILH